MVRVFGLLALLAMPLAAQAAETAGDGLYVIVVSQTTNDDPAWNKVVQALVKKHQGKVVTYHKEPREALPALRANFPRYTCFVATPQEAGRQFVADVHQLTRQYDEDPYTDTRWAILTGYDAANALNIAAYAEPLQVQKVASGTDVELDACVEGLWYDELVKNRYVRKEKGKPKEELKGPDDTTQVLVKTLNEYQPDLFVTSGHATERNWQIGFRYKNGYFQCRDGRLFGSDTQKNEHPIDSANAKIYMPIGNCLMGHVNGPESMAAAWMNSAGVKQMMGYTVTTWFGYGGWGVLDYFVEQPGRYNFQEAFLANHHALIQRLQDPATPPRDRKGLEYDRDTVAFYGDPAWEARMAPGPLWYEQKLTAVNDTYTLTIIPKHGQASFDTVNKNGSQRGGRPFVAYLPQRLKDVKVVTGQELAPVITDDFILVPRPATCDPTKLYQVEFTGRPITKQDVAAAAAAAPQNVPVPNAPAAAAPAESAADPLAVPEKASPQELLAFIQGLSQVKPKSNSTSDRLAHLRQTTAAAISAAEKILAGEADSKTRLAAVDAQIQAYTSLQRIGDRKSMEQLAALAEKFQGDAAPELAARARWVTFQVRASKVMEGNAADALPLLTDMPQVLASSPDPMLPAQIASSIVPQLELSAAINKTSIQAYRDIADALAKSESPKMQKSAKYVEGVIKKLELFGNPVVITGTLLEGAAFDQASLQGKVVLVDFWATWCGPCIAELPNVQECYKKYHDKGFEIVGISLDSDRDQLEKFIKDREIPWPILFEAKEEDQGWHHPMAKTYGISGIPAMFIIGADGKVISLTARGKRLNEILEQQLGSAKTAQAPDGKAAN